MTEVWCLKQTAYEDEHNAMPEWYRADDGVWTSLSNQSHPRQPTDIVRFTFEVDHFDQINERITPEQRRWIQHLVKKRMIDPECTSGWVSPAGEWFPCGWHHHDAFVFHFYGKTVAEVERTHARVKGRFWSIEGGMTTPAMSERLRRMGFILDGELYHMRDLEGID
jgi:hypothetical protein